MYNILDIYSNGMYFCFAGCGWTKIIESFMIDENSALIKTECGCDPTLRIKQNKKEKNG